MGCLSYFRRWSLPSGSRPALVEPSSSDPTNAAPGVGSATESRRFGSLWDVDLSAPALPTHFDFRSDEGHDTVTRLGVGLQVGAPQHQRQDEVGSTLPIVTQGGTLEVTVIMNESTRTPMRNAVPDVVGNGRITSNTPTGTPKLTPPDPGPSKLGGAGVDVTTQIPSNNFVHQQGPTPQTGTSPNFGPTSGLQNGAVSFPSTPTRVDDSISGPVYPADSISNAESYHGAMPVGMIKSMPSADLTPFNPYKSNEIVISDIMPVGMIKPMPSADLSPFNPYNSDDMVVVEPVSGFIYSAIQTRSQRTDRNAIPPKSDMANMANRNSGNSDTFRPVASWKSRSAGPRRLKKFVKQTTVIRG